MTFFMFFESDLENTGLSIFYIYYSFGGIYGGVIFRSVNSAIIF